MSRIVAALLMVLLMLSSALAVQPDEILSDPELEARARAVSADLRCLVCQNQSIDDSDAGLARDLRILVRERIVAGDTNEQTKDYIVARYGEFVLLRPVVAAHTLVLWITAPIVLLLGGMFVFLAARRRQTSSAETASLTAQDQAVLDRLKD